MSGVVPVSGLLQVDLVTEAGVLAVEQAAGRARSVGWRRRDGRSVGFRLLLGQLVVEVVGEVVLEVVLEIVVEVVVEVDVADGWLSPGLALYLDFRLPDAEEDESRGEDDEETGGGEETEGEEAPAGGQSGGERDHSESPLLTEISLSGPAGDVAPVLRAGPHSDTLGDGDQVRGGV